MTPEADLRPFWLTLGLEDDRGPLLAIDLRDPSGVVELNDRRHLDPLPPRALVVVDGAAPELEVVEDDRVLVPRAFLWSLLGPTKTGRRRRLVVHDRLVGEQRLRLAGRSVWRGLRDWGSRDAELRADVRRLLASWSKPHADLLDLLDALAGAAEADPFAFFDLDEPDLPVPAAPSPEPLPDDPHELAAWMGSDDGLGRLYGDGFKPRRGQGDMARDVASAMETDRCLLVEAGTGVGKTLGYLVPLLERVVREETRGVVSTHTRALQSQILDHDLPRLSSLFPGLKARRLMGRANYLCRTRLLRFLQKEVADLQAAWAQASFRLWLDATGDGLREEVEDHPALKRHLMELFDSPEPCSPAVCYGKQECHVQRARRLAREADLVVVNHALLMHDCAAGRKLIGEYRRLVVDEAHRLPQVALDTFSLVCDPIRATILEDLIDAPEAAGKAARLPVRIADRLAVLGEAGVAAGERAVAAGEAFRRTARLLRRWLDVLGEVHGAAGEAPSAEPAYQRRLRVYDRAETFGPVSDVTDELLAACAEAGAAQARFSAALETLPGVPDDLADRLATMARTAEMVQSLEEDLIFLTRVEDEEWVVWLESARNGRIRAAGSTRLDAGDILREQWRDADLAPVAASATLSIGEDFGHMMRELGLSAPGRPPVTSLVESPFDHERQSRILAPSRFPDPNDAGAEPALVDLLARLAVEVPRKVLALFTSYRSLQNVKQGLETSLNEPHLFRTDTTRHWQEDRPVILAQGEGVSPAELLSRFRHERRAVLLGTNTFWEGVDLPGEELEILVVARLPFLVPTDPWVEARSDLLKARGENPFLDFMVRDAVLRLRQGVGRLLRDETDRGVVILLDTRLHTKPYGMTFLKALPVPVRFASTVEDVVDETRDFFAASD